MQSEKTKTTGGELERQRAICRNLREKLDERPQNRLALVDTYGCQQNEADSERIRGWLAEMGFGFTEDEFSADVIVINTCAVREHAEQRALGNIGALSHAKKAKPGQTIAVCGCMAQKEGVAEKIKNSYPIVDLVFGTHELWRFPELLDKAIFGGKRVFETAGNESDLKEGVPIRRAGEIKAWLPIMYGCNNFCSYCIVPYVRGRERSRAPSDVLREAREIVEAGYKDITLLGQNVNSYGRDLGSETDFADILRGVASIDGDFLVRFMTSHPKDAHEKLFSVMAENARCARQLHLPVQSGSDRILKAMNRKYTAEEYLKKAELARTYMPDLVLTTDIIVGFPGETEEDFADTLSLAEKVRFDSMFTFIYSKREGTPAAKMEDGVPREEKQRRFDALLSLANRISAEIHGSWTRRVVRVLVEGETGRGEFNLSSRTNGWRLVHLKGSRELLGKFVNVKITGSNTWALFGELAE